MSPESKSKKTTKTKTDAILNENPAEIKKTVDHEIDQIHGKKLDHDHEITIKRRTKIRKTKRKIAQLLDPLPRNRPDPDRIPNPIQKLSLVIPARIPMDPENANGINPANHQEKTKNLLKKNPNPVRNLKNLKNINRTIQVQIKNIENHHRNPVIKTKIDEKIVEKETKKMNRKILSEYIDFTEKSQIPHTKMYIYFLIEPIKCHHKTSKDLNQELCMIIRNI